MAGGFRWDDSDAQDFIDYGRYFVPDRELQLETICSLIPPTSAPCHIVDLCCGEGLLSRALLDCFPECHVHGFDGSQRMIQHAVEMLVGYGDRFEAKLFDLATSSWYELPSPVHAVVSSLAVHHLNQQGKQALFEDVMRCLEPCGVFIIADLVQPVTRLGIRLAEKSWSEVVRQRSLELDGNLKAYECFRDEHWNFYSDPNPDPIDMPSPLFDQLKWLEKAGFVDVDVFWMKAGHAIFAGRKP